MDKSHVGLGTYVCPVCGIKHGEVVLLDKRLKDTFTRDMHMGLDLCPEHKNLHEQGYIALVGCEVPDDCPALSSVKVDALPRTGKIAHVRKEAWHAIFKDEVPLPDQPLVFVDDQVIINLTEYMNAQATHAPASTNGSTTIH